MTTLLDSPHSHQIKAVSFPCGPAQQYRVQFCEFDTDQWRMFGSFQRRDQAVDYLNDLQGRGYQARLVDYRCCPTAG